MKTTLNPVELDQLGQHFYQYVEHHIEQLEKSYLEQLPEIPFVLFCFQLFMDHYRLVHNIEKNKN